MLQPPGVLTVILHVLQGRRAEGQGGHSPAGGPNPPLLSAFHPIKSPNASVGVRSQQDHRLPLLHGVSLSISAAASSHSLGMSSSGHQAPAPHGPSAQPGLQECSASSQREGGDSISGARSLPSRGDRSKPLASGSGHEPLKIAHFLESSCQKTCPPPPLRGK